MTTVSIFMPNLVQGTLAEASGYTMLLVKPSDKSLLNGAGDSLAWAGNGWLTAEIAEPWTETLSVTVVDGDGLVPFGGWLGVGSDVVADGVAELNTEGRTAIADAVDTKLSDTHGDGSWGGGGGSGGGSPVFTAVVVARIATGSAAGWPEDFTIGDAYLTENAGAQPLFIKDVADNILSGLGTKNFSDPDFVGALRLAPLTDGTRTLDTPPTTIEVKSTDDVGIVYNDDTAGAEYFELQIPRAKTLMGVTKTKYSCQFIMNWGIDNTFERTVNLGEIKFLRKNAPAT